MMKAASRNDVLVALSEQHRRDRREETPGPEACDANVVDWVQAQVLAWSLFRDICERSMLRDWYYAGWVGLLKPFEVPYYTLFLDDPPEGLAYGAFPTLDQLEAIDDLHYRAIVMLKMNLMGTCERSRALILSVKDDSIPGLFLQANLEIRPPSPTPPGRKALPPWHTPSRRRSPPDWTGFRFWEPDFWDAKPQEK